MTTILSPKIFSLPDILMWSWNCAMPASQRPLSRLRLVQHPSPGYYRRQIRDLPCQGNRVCLKVDVRRVHCINASCPRCTFAESVPISCRYQRRSSRLQTVYAQVGLALGASPGGNLLQHLGMHVSVNTLLRTLHRVTTEIALPGPKVVHREIGIDNWAHRRERRYGTILVDLVQRQPIDLLLDRHASPVAAWLARHPEIRIVILNRAGAYADAVRQGAPAAM